MKLRVLLPRVGTLIHLNCVQICLDLKAFYSASWNIILICKRYRRFVELSWPSVTFDRFIYKELNIWPWESVLVSLPNSLKHLFFSFSFSLLIFIWCVQCFPKGHDNPDIWRNEDDHATCGLESDEDSGLRIPTQAQAIVEGSGSVAVSELKPAADVDYIQVRRLLSPRSLTWMFHALYCSYICKIGRIWVWVLCCNRACLY